MRASCIGSTADSRLVIFSVLDVAMEAELFRRLNLDRDRGCRAMGGQTLGVAGSSRR